MGDDGEIKRLIRKESESFLKHALFQAKGGEDSYDFEAEFAKTRRNKSFLVLGVTAITILCLGAVALAVTSSVEKRTAATPVSVSAFQDLNLKDILDSSKQDEAALDRAKTGLTHLGTDLDSGLSFADSDFRASKLSISTLGLSHDEETSRIAQVAAARDASKAQLQAGYASAAAASRSEIAKIQNRIDRYDSRSLARAKSEQAVLDNERVAAELEKDQQAKLYESRIGVIEAAGRRDFEALGRQKNELAAALTTRFNPTFSDLRATSLLAPRGEVHEPQLAPFDPYLDQAGILDPIAESRLDDSLSNLEFLSGKLRAVPYLNSVPFALSRIEAEAMASIGSYRAALHTAASGLAARDAAIASLKATLADAKGRFERYRSALATAASESVDSGYVIDVSDPARILVFLEPGSGVREGDKGYLVRQGELVVAVSFTFEGEDAYALVTGVEGAKRPRAFDSILLVAPRKVAQAGVDPSGPSGVVLADELGTSLSLEAEVEPVPERVAALRAIVEQLRSWKSLSIESLRAVNSAEMLQVIVIPGDFTVEGVSLAQAVPEGIRLEYRSSTEYDFKILSKGKVVRLRGIYSGEAEMDAAALAAYENPASVASPDNPLYVRSRLDEAAASESRRLEERPAILAALNGSKPIDAKAVAKLDEIVAANPKLTKPEAAKALKASGFPLTSLEISAIFLVDFGRP